VAIGVFVPRLGLPALLTLSFITLALGSQAMIYASAGVRISLEHPRQPPARASSVIDEGIAAALALSGFVLAPPPVADVAATRAAAGLFDLALELVKRPDFARLGIS
jgi:hypothetical protein